MDGFARPLGTSIRIFLADGAADGVWVVEKSNWTGKALTAPRTRYKDLRSDLSGPGVYVLAGPSDSGTPTLRIYIGETDDLPGRSALPCLPGASWCGRAPSQAAMVLLGGTANGRIEWRTSGGQTLKQLQDADLGGDFLDYNGTG